MSEQQSTVPNGQTVDPEDTGRGILITFEGSEGSGKTTQIARLAEHLEQFEAEVIVTREPGGTRLGEEVRHLLKHGEEASTIFAETELLLFAASRAQLVREVMIPALEQGKTILCDRYLDSTTVYQGVGRRISSEPVQMINSFAAGNLLPDLTIILDIPPEVGFRRIRHRLNDLPDRMERETIDFYRNVREGYLVLAKALPDRYLVVDGSRDEDTIDAEIWAEIQRRFT